MGASIVSSCGSLKYGEYATIFTNTDEMEMPFMKLGDNKEYEVNYTQCSDAMMLEIFGSYWIDGIDGLCLQDLQRTSSFLQSYARCYIPADKQNDIRFRIFSSRFQVGSMRVSCADSPQYALFNISVNGGIVKIPSMTKGTLTSYNLLIDNETQCADDSISVSLFGGGWQGNADLLVTNSVNGYECYSTYDSTFEQCAGISSDNWSNTQIIISAKEQTEDMFIEVICDKESIPKTNISLNDEPLSISNLSKDEKRYFALEAGEECVGPITVSISDSNDNLYLFVTVNTMSGIDESESTQNVHTRPTLTYFHCGYQQQKCDNIPSTDYWQNIKIMLYAKNATSESFIKATCHKRESTNWVLFLFTLGCFINH